MKNTLIILLLIIGLTACKSKDGCDSTYSDCNNQTLSKDLGIFCAMDSPSSSEYIEIINASCKTLSTEDYTLGVEGNQEGYKLDKIKLKPGERKVYSNLPFQINDNGDVIYLKLKGKIISTLHLM